MCKYSYLHGSRVLRRVQPALQRKLPTHRDQNCLFWMDVAITSPAFMTCYSLSKLAVLHKLQHACVANLLLSSALSFNLQI